jgi:acetyl esterase/lipase
LLNPGVKPLQRMPVRSRVLALLALLVTVACASSTPSARVPTPAAPVPTTAPLPPFQTITYCHPSGRPLSMDIWAPAPGSRLPAPVVLHVHGGGWTGGNRKGGGYLGDVQPQLTQRGFLVASIDYRLAPANPWPAQITDVRCAVGYLRANAAGLGIDPKRIGAWGESAGGHLVSLLGTDGGVDGVQAVADLFGPADLTSSDWSPGVERILQNVFGSSAEVRRDASPVSHVAAGDPPYLILQGDQDTTVPETQSIELAQRLRSVGVPVTLVIVKGGRHGLSGPGMDPMQADLENRLVEFLTSRLAAPAA